jgi:hypothetical protein
VRGKPRQNARVNLRRLAETARDLGERVYAGVDAMAMSLDEDLGGAAAGGDERLAILEELVADLRRAVGHVLRIQAHMIGSDLDMELDP